MRVLVDALNLSLSQGTGLATYARNVCRANQEAGNQVEILYEFLAPRGRTALEEELAFYDPRYGISPRTDRILNLALLARQVAWPRPVLARPLRFEGFVDTRSLQDQLPRFDRILTSPLIYRRARVYFKLTGRFLPVVADPMPDVAHWTTPHPIYMPNTRNIYTIHDVIPLKLPYTTMDDRRRYLGMIKGAVNHASQIISVSETTTRDLLAIAPEAAGKITNTSQSIAPLRSDFARNPDDRQQLRNLLGVDHKKFFIFLSAIEPKKNLGRLIEAFLASDSPYPLVVVGKKAWLYENELRPLNYQATREKLGLTPKGKTRIVQLDYVSHDLVGKLVRAARAVLFPSLYEGFGLPILEAMTAGTPVMTSNSGAMAEIARPGTALLIDPLNVEEMTGAIERLARDDDLCTKLSATGMARARDYNWDDYRKKLMQAYENGVPG